MRILVIGSGAREHALLWKLRQSPKVSALFVSPGNPGMDEVATCLPPREGTDTNAMYADLAGEHNVDLTIVGPENLLVDGIVDHFHERGLHVFGPTAAAAQLEGSKVWAKEVMQRVGIPTASWRVFEDIESATAYARELDFRCVIKADGLASGKGSFVCRSADDVESSLGILLGEKRYGNKPVLVEELLDGQEVSVFALSDGRVVVPFGAAQDHKRLGDKDTGPNTGGMGAYSPVDHMSVAQGFAESFFQPIVTGLAALGTPFVGVLYAGAIVTDQGPKILEFNCRFGDPEAEVLLCRLDDDLAELLWAATRGELHKRVAPNWNTQDALCVVISTDKYPREGDFGTPIYGIDDARNIPAVVVFHAGTDRDLSTGALVTHGGRILTVTALGGNLEEARARAYGAVERIQFAGKYFRTDIGAKATGTVWTFRSEWRKPPNWEVQMMQISQMISDVATGLEEMQLLGQPQSAAELQSLLDRLYEIKLTLHPAQHTGDQAATVTKEPSSAERLSALSADFDAMLERMQDPDVKRGIDAAFLAPPSEYDKIVTSHGIDRKRD